MGAVKEEYLQGREIFSDKGRSLPDGGYDGLSLFGVRGATALPYQLMRCDIPLDSLPPLILQTVNWIGWRVSFSHHVT